METKKISELTEVTSPTSTDVFPIVNDGETKKVQLTNIKNTLGINEIDTRLTTAEGEIDTAQSDINNAEAVIGNETDTYSASSTYALGDLVIYNSLLYKCTTAITVAEAWNSAKWTQVSLTSLANDGDVYSTSEQVIGKWIDGKKIYRKVISYNKPAGESESTIVHNISNIGTIISYKAMSKIQTGDWRALPSFYTPNIATYNQSIYSMNNTNFSIYYSTWYASRSATINIIIEYTKTTD